MHREGGWSLHTCIGVERAWLGRATATVRSLGRGAARPEEGRLRSTATEDRLSAPAPKAFTAIEPCHSTKTRQRFTRRKAGVVSFSNNKYVMSS